jgi:hypothetical protein
MLNVGVFPTTGNMASPRLLCIALPDNTLAGRESQSTRGAQVAECMGNERSSET